MLGTTTMVKVGQKIPFKSAYVISIALQLLMILALPMLAFWSAEEAAWQCWGCLRSVLDDKLENLQIRVVIRLLQPG